MIKNKSEDTSLPGQIEKSSMLLIGDEAIASNETISKKAIEK